MSPACQPGERRGDQPLPCTQGVAEKLNTTEQWSVRKSDDPNGMKARCTASRGRPECGDGAAGSTRPSAGRSPNHASVRACCGLRLARGGGIRRRACAALTPWRARPDEDVMWPRIPHCRKLLLFLLLSLTDLWLTWFLVQRSDGAVYEGNPVAAWWLSRYGLPGLALFKGGWWFW